jgi:phage regulator Rha-like protein
MNTLTIVNEKGELVIDSREVAQLVGKNHFDLLRSIRNYIAILR